jgi:hypothetical protein
MKVPTDATKVFIPIQQSAQNTANPLTTGFVTDAYFTKTLNISNGTIFVDRLRGGTRYLISSDTSVEATDWTANFGSNTQILFTAGATSQLTASWCFQRAPSFFDEVCYTGTGANQNITHNLSVAPELVIVKSRSSNPGAQWVVWNQTLNGSTGYLYLNGDQAAANFAGVWNGAPTSSYFTLGTNYQNNGSGVTFVAYLFATCAGVSKVGSYTGNGTTQTINCGFTGGARFVLIKRTDATGGWYTYDTARGMTTLTDPYVLQNDPAAQVATLGSVTTVTTGFALNSTILAAINTNAASYIFLAIA